jgi:hypothetical protein
MSDCPILQQNLLIIEPGSINIENFIPGRVYKEKLKITNTSKIPIIINLKASDKSKLLLNKSLLRIEVNDAKTVDLVIQDKINYSSNKLPTTPRTIFILINGEFIEEKFPITLMYFCNNFTYKQKPNFTKKEIPSIYLTQYNNLYQDSNTNRRLLIDRTCNIFINRYENNHVASLKNKINNLMQQIAYMQKNGGKLYKNNAYYTKTNTSFFIMKDKLDDPQGKFKIDEDIDKNTVIAKNKILLTENLVLSQRIKILEEKLSKYETFENNDYNNDNYNENDNQHYFKDDNINNNNNNYNNNIYNETEDNNENNENVNNFENEKNELSDEQDYQFQEEGKDININNNEKFDNNDY